jgi:hypothetical protein
MKITKKQLRRIIKEEKTKLLREIDWFGLGSKVDALDDKQRGALDTLKAVLDDALRVGIPPDTIRETIKARIG